MRENLTVKSVPTFTSAMDKALYILSHGKLSRKENTLLFENESVRKFFPINSIDEIFVFSEITINSKLLNFLSQHGIIVHFFNYYGYYSGSFYPREKYVSGRLLVLQVENYIDTEKRLYLARSFVESSLFHMIRNLKSISSKVEYDFKELVGELYSLNSIEEIMGFEGRFREKYYKLYFNLEKRTKRPPLDDTNALISFGNSLMYATIIKEIYKTQLNPAISFLHEPSERRFSLALDLAEIFKPLVIDPLVHKLVSKRIIVKDDFVKELNYKYLNDSGRRKFINHYEQALSRTIRHRKLKRNVSYRFLIRLECYKLIKHFLNDEVYKPLKAWW